VNFAYLAEYSTDEQQELSGNFGGPTPEELESEIKVEIHEMLVPENENVDDAIKQYLRKVQKAKLLTATEEIRLAIHVAKGDKSARDRIVEANLRLVVKIARLYVGFGLPFLDLIAEGNLGLLKAAESFDLSKGCRFSTYAYLCIRNSMLRALANQSRVVRLPVYVSDSLNKMKKATRELRKTLNRDPSEKEIANEMGVSILQIHQLILFSKKAMSTEQQFGIDDGYALGDTIEDASAVSPAAMVENLESYELLTECFQCLSDKEKMILTLRFGLDGNNPQTLATVGSTLGVTRERVRQLEAHTLGKLRKLIAETGPRRGTQRLQAFVPC
jgi:RNA polymerase primary sigma factor